MPSSSASDLFLRDVTESDVPIFFEHQRDPEAAEMALFPAREWEAHVAHWAKSMANASGILKTIVLDGQVAGNVVSWEQSGERLVGYWIGKDYWGKGVATKALSEFLRQVHIRPLYARVAKTNIGSIRVLEKCGFSIRGEERDSDGVEELLFELRFAGDPSAETGRAVGR
jgi:RimJ/RimL family protein N-acetyltransferase